MHPSATAAAPRRRRSIALEITAIVGIGVLLAAAIAAAFASLYRSFWGPAAFTERYVQLLADGRAADALAIPGVATDSEELEAAGLPSYASDALMRKEALSDDITEIRLLSTRAVGDVTEVTIGYLAGEEPGETTFRVEQTGWNGMVPSWRFATSPLTVLNVEVPGSWRFSVNGFEVDKRQVSPDGPRADPADGIPLLAFAPMVYNIEVDTQTTVADPVGIAATTPLSDLEADIATTPSDEFIQVVQDEAKAWLSEGCGSRHVLQPEDCPYGYQLDDRLAPGTEPTWSVPEFPDIELDPDGAWWAIADADGVARIEMDVQSIVDGSITHVAEDVPFRIDGSVVLLPDGSARIQIGAPLLR